MSDKLVLTNFTMSAGRVEVARMIMAQGGIDYEDRRLTKEEWRASKSSKANCILEVNIIHTFLLLSVELDTPTGQLPMLEVNGAKIGQSLAIANFVAKKAGLCGKNDVEAAQAEMINLSIEEIVQSTVL